MITPVVNKIKFNGMTEYGNKFFPVMAPELDDINPDSQGYLKHISAISGYLPSNSTPITMYD